MIVRTVAEGVTEEHFRREVESLLHAWRKINRKKRFVRAPALLQRETSLTRGIIRDLFSDKVDALHVDSKELYNEVEQYLKQIDPELMERVTSTTTRPRCSTSSTSRPKSGTSSRRAASCPPAATSSSSPPRRWCRST